jgi:hypothetical protein
MDRQGYWRQRYADLRPGWRPTTAIYASYVAINEPLFRVAVLLQRLDDLPSLRSSRVHIVGVYRTRSSDGV